jgi:hypothetical protein
VSFEIHPVTPDRWPDMVELFERRGVWGGRRNAAVAYAFAHGAASVEAYPHVPKRTDYMGHIELYRRAGFAHVRDANRRAIVRVE